MKTNIKFIILWFFLITSFLLLALFVLYEANGYRLNRQTWRLEPTGLISLDGQPKQVDSIIINSKKKSTILPYRTKKILPGVYEIKINKENFTTWIKTVRIDGGQAFEEKKIILFLAEPVKSDSKSNTTIEQLKNDAQNQGKYLTVKANEIYYQDELVTRFSDSVKSAILTDDKAHIMVQIGQELRVIELDGSNNTKLIDFPTNDAYAFTQNNEKVYYFDKDKLVEVKVR